MYGQPGRRLHRLLGVEIGGSRETSVCLQAVHEQRYWPDGEEIERYDCWEVRHALFQPTRSTCFLFFVIYETLPMNIGNIERLLPLATNWTEHKPCIYSQH